MAATGLIMLYYALIFLVIALIFGTLGYTGIAGVATGVAEFIFFASLALCITLLTFNRHGNEVTTTHPVDDKS